MIGSVAGVEVSGWVVVGLSHMKKGRSSSKGERELPAEARQVGGATNADIKLAQYRKACR
jgi:hypothetical protein